MRIPSVCVVLLLSSVLAVSAQHVPQEIDYQGKILVNEVPYTGSGFFKFAVSDEAGTTNHWANDGTGSGEPVAGYSNDVYNGVFSVDLGNPDMTALSSDLFDVPTGLVLRVWFSEDDVTYDELLPAQQLVSTPYALNADQLDGKHLAEIVIEVSTNVTLNGDVTGTAAANQIAAGVIVDADINAAAAIQASKIVNTALVQNTSFAGDVAGSYDNLQLVAGAITDADINAAANIAGSKIQMATTNVKGVVQISGGFGVVPPFDVIADTDSRLHAFGVVNVHTASAPNSVLNITGTGRTVISNTAANTVEIHVPGVRIDNIVWVGVNGSPGGPGTIDAPFDQPQGAYDVAATNFAGSPAAIVIAPGVYDPLTMYADNVHVKGLTSPELKGLTATSAVSGVAGKVRVEDIVFIDVSVVAPSARNLKFHNCRFLQPLPVDGSDIEFQDCFFTVRPGGGSAVFVGAFATNPVRRVGFYQSSFKNNDAAATIDIGPIVDTFEVIGCEIINRSGVGAAVADVGIPASGIPHLYTHNYMKGPPSNAGIGPNVPTFIDAAGGPGGTIIFTHNTVIGDVGLAFPGAPQAQYYGNNMVYGLINHPGAPATVGWVQAGGGTGMDAAGNIEHELTPIPGPDVWND